MIDMINILPKSISYGKVRNLDSVLYIVIHYTGNNNDSAVSNGNYFKQVNTRSAGAHFFVDQKGTVVSSVPVERIAYSVGGGRYNDYKQTGGAKYYNKCTNANSISIELCDIVSKDPSPDMVKSVSLLVKYIKSKCKNANTIIRHFDVNGKPCPLSMVDNTKWNKFLSDLDNVKINDGSTKVDFKVKVLDNDLNIRSGPGTNHQINGVIRDNGIYTIVEVNGSWGRLKSGAGWINISDKYVRRL